MRQERERERERERNFHPHNIKRTIKTPTEKCNPYNLQQSFSKTMS